MTERTEDRRAALLQHLESLYTFAQALTLDAMHATRLTEKTYVLAGAEATGGISPGDEKAWLLGLMLQIHEGQDAEEPHVGLTEVSAPPSLSVSEGFRKRVAEKLVDRVFPAAIAALPDDQRLLLLLCDLEGLSCIEAGRVLRTEAVQTCDYLQDARSRLFNAVYSDVSDAERQLLDRVLPEDWIQAALKRTMQAEFIPLPPTLRVSASAALEQEPAPEREAADGVEDAAPSESMHPRRDAFGAAKRLTVASVLILTAGLVGYGITRALKEEPDVNLITLSAKEAKDVTPAFRTSSLEQAERFVFDRFHWSLTVPGIDGAVLSGVAIVEIAPAVEIPAFIFQDPASDGRITLYAYTYALLDRYETRLQLERDILQQIQNERHFDLHDLGENKVLVWRNRDEIYVAVTTGEAESLRDRISFPS